MKRKSFRSLAVFLAALIVFITIPVMPIFAASNVNSITIKVNSEIQNFAIYDGTKSVLDAYDTNGWATLVEEGLDQSVTQIQIGNQTYTLTKESDGFKLTPKSSGNFDGTVRLGVYADKNALSYNAKDNAGHTKQKDLTLTPDDVDGFYYASISLGFSGIRGEFKEYNGNMDLTFSVPTPTYTMTLPADTADFSVVAEKTTVEQGGTFTFSLNVYSTAMEPVVTKQVGSNAQREVVKASAGPEKHNTYETYEYKIEKVQEDHQIFVSLQNKTFKVTVNGFDSTSMVSNLNFASGTTYTGSVNQGGSFSFMLSSKEDYSTPKVTYQMGEKDNETIEPVGNTYTVNDVTENLTITITPGTQKQYNVSYPTGGVEYGYTATATVDGRGIAESGNQIKHGKTLVFTVTVNKNYNKSKPVINASAPYTLSSDDGVYTYTFKDVKSDISIDVSGLSLNQYRVSLPTSTAQYTVSGNGNTVYAGGTYQFTLTLANGYEYTESKDDIVTVQGAEKDVNQSGKIYTVKLSNFTQDVTVTPNPAIAAQTFTVTQPIGGESKYTFNFSSGNGTDIAYGTDVSFTVEPKPGYRVKLVTFTEKGVGAVPTSATSIGDNLYKIPSVTANYTISVECELIKVTVNYTRNAVSGFGLSFNASTITETYDVENNSTKFDTSDGQLKLKYEELPSPDRTGFTATEWFMNEKPIQEDILIEGTGDRTFNVSCSYTLINPETSDGSNGLIHADSSAPEDSSVEGTTKHKVTWQATVDLTKLTGSDDSVIQSAIASGNFEIKSYGMLYSRNLIDNPARYINAIKGLSESKFLDDTVYCYYHSNDDKRLGYGSPYKQKITVDINKESGYRYGIIWFEISIDGRDYVIFSRSQTYTVPTK